MPELASRAHQKNIIPVIDQAIKKANINKNQISAVAFTRGPGSWLSISWCIIC